MNHYKHEIVLENLRNLFLSLTTSTMLIPLIGMEILVLIFGIVLGIYHGFRIEKEISVQRSFHFYKV